MEAMYLAGLVADSALVRWYGINNDIETLKQAGEKLRQDEMDLQQVVDTIAQLVLLLSPEGRALHANRLMLDYTGLYPEEVKAEDFRARVFHTEDIERLQEVRQAVVTPVFRLTTNRE